MVTLLSPMMKPVPVMVTGVSTAASPLFGVIASTVGLPRNPALILMGPVTLGQVQETGCVRS